ncbi:hypothetical protein B0H14DRAFT_3471865 [Mycena olivaceomarginata]|nr:hypothetical protein B0H14DRAFT_3471865 [Mycena olivaceomarginata]
MASSSDGLDSMITTPFSSAGDMRYHLQSLLDAKERQLQQAGALGQRVLAQQMELEERIRQLQWRGWDLPADFPGYDNALIYDKSETGEKKSGVSNVVRAALSSDVSGIQLDIRSDQPAVQVYLASLNLPRKEAHGGPEKKYGERSTVAIEQEGWINAINTREWNQNQIYSPERRFNWNTVYTFSVVR